jgi:hypothetical protein
MTTQREGVDQICSRVIIHAGEVQPLLARMAPHPIRPSGCIFWGSATVTAAVAVVNGAASYW